MTKAIKYYKLGQGLEKTEDKSKIIPNFSYKPDGEVHAYNFSQIVQQAFDKKNKNIEFELDKGQNSLIKLLKKFLEKNKDDLNLKRKDQQKESRIVGRILSCVTDDEQKADIEVKIENEQTKKEPEHIDGAVDFIFSPHKSKLSLKQNVMDLISNDNEYYICEVKLSTLTHKPDIKKDLEKLMYIKGEETKKKKTNLHCCFIYIDLKEPVIYVFELV